MHFRIIGWFVIIALMLSASVTRHALAQTKDRDNFGTDFYVAFGPNLGGEDNRGTTTLTVMDLYITSHVPAKGTVEVPALNFFKTFSTTPGQITTVHLPNGNNFSQTVELDEGQDEQVIHGMAVHITSDSAIAVFGLNHKEYSSDAFMALPNNVLGTEYRTMNYNSSSDGFGDVTPGEFWIVAVEDSTNVTITPAATTSRSSPANLPFTTRLNKGDAFLVQGSTFDVGNDLTGSHIESDHAIAVFSGHKRTEMPQGATNSSGSPSRDHLVEELPPVSAWGDSALVVPYATSSLPDLVRVVCAEDGTDISVNGTKVGTFNAGEFYEIRRLGGVTSIQASKPIEVGQYMHTSYGSLDGRPPPPAYGDPALALVFPVEQFATSYTVVSIENADAFTGNFVNIVADQSAVGSMTIDGVPMNASEFKAIPGSHYAYAQHALQQGTHNITGAKPFGVTIYALGPVDSYAYTGGTLLKTITPLKTVGLVIDFGDRVLSGNFFGPVNQFDTTVYLQNVSEDVVNIYDFPKRIQDTDRFFVTSPVVSSSTPRTIGPGALDSMTIQFYPHEVNRRMHTQITAKTDHLRAYVVDVYGRGVQDEMGVFADTSKVIAIDTLDFGLFSKTDPPADSEVFLGNAGTALLQITNMQVTGEPEFTKTSVLYNGAIVGATLNIPEPPSGAARINLRFDPTGQTNGYHYAQLAITSSSGPIKIVILKARVETITPLSPSVSSVSFGPTMVCNDSVFTVSVSNAQNGLPVTLTDATIIGTNSGDFALATKTPLSINAGGNATLQVFFSPVDSGVKTAQVVLHFNLPKNAAPDTIQLSGSASKRLLEFSAADNIHSYATDDFLVPIYAKTDITPFKADGYIIYLTYDTVNLRLLDIITNKTLTPTGYPSIFTSKPPGHDTILYQQGSEHGGGGTPLAGGGPGSLPLVYLKFRPVLNGADAKLFQKDFHIAFKLLLNNSQIADACVDRIFDTGYVQVVSVCSPPFLSPRSAIPSMTALADPSPNPFSSATTIGYDVADELPVRIQVVDASGVIVRTLVDAVQKPGYYSASLIGSGLPSGVYLVTMDAGDYHRARRMVLGK